jgi:hypothetical protein
MHDNLINHFYVGVYEVENFIKYFNMSISGSCEYRIGFPVLSSFRKAPIIFSIWWKIQPLSGFIENSWIYPANQFNENVCRVHIKCLINKHKWKFYIKCRFKWNHDISFSIHLLNWIAGLWPFREPFTRKYNQIFIIPYTWGK